jgi:hypothetical protein
LERNCQQRAEQQGRADDGPHPPREHIRQRDAEDAHQEDGERDPTERVEHRPRLLDILAVQRDERTPDRPQRAALQTNTTAAMANASVSNRCETETPTTSNAAGISELNASYATPAASTELNASYATPAASTELNASYATPAASTVMCRSRATAVTVATSSRAVRSHSPAPRQSPER